MIDTDTRLAIERLARTLRFAPAERGGVAGSDPGGRIGRSGEFEEFRPWRPGDDLRTLDLGVYRRLRRRVARVDREESGVPLTLLIDRSASMAEPARERCVQELSLLFVSIAIEAGEPVRAFTYVAELPEPLPSPSAAAVERALDDRPCAGDSDAARAFRALPVDPQGPGRVIVLTDGFGLREGTDLAPLTLGGRVWLIAPWTAEEWQPSARGSVLFQSRENEPSWRGVVNAATLEEYRASGDRRWRALHRALLPTGGRAERIVAEEGARGLIDRALRHGEWLRR